MLDENSLMTSRFRGKSGGHSVVSLLLSGSSATGAVCEGGGGGGVPIICFFTLRDEIVVFDSNDVLCIYWCRRYSHLLDFFRMGHSGKGKSGTASRFFCGFGTCSLKDEVFAS